MCRKELVFKRSEWPGFTRCFLFIRLRQFVLFVGAGPALTLVSPAASAIPVDISLDRIAPTCSRKNSMPVRPGGLMVQHHAKNCSASRSVAEDDKFRAAEYRAATPVDGACCTSSSKTLDRYFQLFITLKYLDASRRVALSTGIGGVIPHLSQIANSGLRS